MTPLGPNSGSKGEERSVPEHGRSTAEPKQRCCSKGAMSEMQLPYNVPIKQSLGLGEPMELHEHKPIAPRLLETAQKSNALSTLRLGETEIEPTDE
eukprot:1202734-Ditylum_brightwellii.AAC.1